MAILEPARHVHGPAVIAEVPTHLAHHRGDGERQETAALFGVEAVDRIDQTQSGDLTQVLEVLTAPVIVARDVLRQRQAAFDDRVAMTLMLRCALVEHTHDAEHVDDVGVFVVVPA